ncbi:M20 family peptidase [Rugamonas sp. CCM 8940]|uniref:M20 family peptidase n=1 Tax=Rugamonas sp. CCM 8940 TaxID=2765359 RepID=UPI0018F62194|nr:M20 family peptidase [Rugamonas sp. CCM 8940]MBJ7312748.1 M20 family peptidase [Rugamonas sp. CCM 8940]
MIQTKISTKRASRKRFIPRLLLALLAAVAALAGVLAFNTLRSESRQLQVAPAAPPALDEAAAAGRLAAALRWRTIASAADAEAGADQFLGLQAQLAQAFPRLHAALKREVVGHSLLYTWAGSDAAAKPALWLAHQDVVPVAPGTEADWLQPPFDGVVKDGYIWGRGAWDDKGSLLAQMEAVETLLAAGFAPRRTLYLAYGADEEVGGRRGAVALAALLKSRGVRLDYVLDEGMLVTEGILAGLDKPAALIGVAEKGYASVDLELAMAPGHSSMPPRASAIGQLSAALARLEQQQLPASMDGMAQDMFATLAPEMSGFQRVALANLWLFGPLLQRQLEQSASTNAMLRSTTALTIVHAGNKDNVLPGKANATVNFRLLPGDSVAGVLDHVRRSIDNPAIKLSVQPGQSEPSAVSRTDTPQYATLNRTVRQVFSGAVVVPGLVLGATDSRHFAALSDNIFKFSPVRAGPKDLARFHGSNERIAISNYVEMIRFYHQLLRNGAPAGQDATAAP